MSLRYPCPCQRTPVTEDAMPEYIDHTAAYWREHFNLDHLPYDTATPVPFGHVVRVRSREYCLHWHQPSERARWGTAAEIAEDIAYLARTGVLPPALGTRW